MKLSPISASGSKNHESLTNDFINYEIPDKFSFNNRQVNGDNGSCQIISEPDHTFLKSNDFENKYLEISNYILIESKQGRIPRWYTFLKDKITLQSLQSNTGRLNIDLGHNLIQNSRVQRPRPPPVQSDHITHKGKASGLQPGPTLLQTLYIKLLTSTHFANTAPVMYLEHWIPVPGINTSNNNNLTPRSPNIISPIILATKLRNASS
ncbi:uncharacterized protein OCT59_024795 [Rhizophagus irregularis]|uniref:Uncharacterized protein n=2 Tax=Rhizophagus irregularis TaxID=588596 RepID=A0A015KDS8_RHIIW|nr:hypothetical protein GLOIN_2v1781048 [Rhizophagus irregularis DAOM 181602=DAOM 197198]EXX77755.1 hypothetical protein RirG_020940 [Rhizophagus irregularis DAOM 197198w]POG66066.1 hypothetical protein GLOIN_2v1781048 [Rhizophagus irregularis DAOM 181602=DAOM 197198]UZO04409.1 hypothetical protein OCT59_024795 [Rhizophagus irregularis]CAG8728755.1 328_t:CDS:1 [Rhizophagus irregularis]|eukprot:XP_025172932.1 hypothetical protein GLOIN_2v1781048 [Rhizophagus irregularis DAOM 181602=DAOM 197198]